MTELVRYDAMCRAIDAAYQVDEIKDIRDKAKAWEEYSRLAKNTENERRACEIRLRAERKAGQLLRKMEKAKGKAGPGRGKAGQTAGAAFDNAPTLSALGISKDQSSRWQKLAAVPSDEFEAALAGTDKPTTNGILLRNGEIRTKPMDDRAIWIWGRVLDFERNGTLDDDPRRVWAEMAQHMRADLRRLVPQIIQWLEGCNER